MRWTTKRKTKKKHTVVRTAGKEPTTHICDPGSEFQVFIHIAGGREKRKGEDKKWEGGNKKAKT